MRRRAIEAEAAEELQFHLDQEMASHVARGVSPGEARRLALRDLGGLAQTREAVREVRSLWPDAVWRDVRYAVRALCGAPAFTAVALAVLTLSIGALTAIFSVVDAVVLRGLPFDEGDRLMAVYETNVKDPAWNGDHLSAPQDFYDWRDQQDVFTDLAAVGYAGVGLRPAGDEFPEKLHAEAVTASFFAVLRVMPAIGRAFAAENEVDGGARVAIISDGLWRRRFGARPDVIGAHLSGQQVDFEIIGVMPAGFSYPVGAAEATDVWLPYVAGPESRVRGNSFGYNLQVFGRLRDGVSRAAAQARMEQINHSLAVDTPTWFQDAAIHVDPLSDDIVRPVRRWMVMLLAAVSLVVLIACVNLANLQLVRATGRSREFALRAALGASPWDLTRALLIENLVLSFAGAALGVSVAWFGVQVLRAAIPPEVPRIATIAVNLRVLLTTGAVAILTGMLFGVLPVLRFARPDATGSTRVGERAQTADAHSQWLRGVLVIAEVALAVVLVIGSGLFIASFARVAHVDLGFDPQRVLAVQVRSLAPPSDYDAVLARTRPQFERVLEHVRRIPGVEVASIAGGGLPLRGDLRTVALAIPGRNLPRNEDIALNQISPDYFAAIGVPLRAGRPFGADDRDGAPNVMILNEAAAAKYFGGSGASALGQVVRLSGRTEYTVVGIVGDVRYDGPESGSRTQAFVPLAQSRLTGATFVIRVAGGAAGVLPEVRAALWSEFPDAGRLLSIDIGTLDGFVSRLLAERRFNMVLLSLFGALGLLIASVGIYGVMAYVVSRRTREIGVRMALGAAPSGILAAVMAQAGRYLLLGVSGGLAAAWLLSRWLTSFLFEVHPHDATVYLSTSVTLAAIGLLSAAVPAWRAASVDPVSALKAD
jgi:putative ABC transport system permease protein